MRLNNVYIFFNGVILVFFSVPVIVNQENGEQVDPTLTTPGEHQALRRVNKLLPVILKPVVHSHFLSR